MTQALGWIQIRYSAISIVGYLDTLYLDAEDDSISVDGIMVDTLSPDSRSILSRILSEYGKFAAHSRIFSEDFHNDHSDSPLIQSLLVLCDSIRESVADSRILSILDSIQSARLASV